jgi:SAM-dependent methyltransferase
LEHLATVDFYYDGFTLPFKDNYFDLVVSFEVFEHVFNLEDILTELRRVIKPGGKLYFTTPFLFPEHEAPFDYQRLTRYRWSQLLGEKGFHVDSQSQEPNDIQSLFQLMIYWIAKNLNPKSSILRQIVLIPVITFFNLNSLLFGKFFNSRNGYQLTNIVKCHKL